MFVFQGVNHLMDLRYLALLCHPGLASLKTDTQHHCHQDALVSVHVFPYSAGHEVPQDQKLNGSAPDPPGIIHVGINLPPFFWLEKID